MAYVLVVDDDEQFASAVARVLGAQGHEVGTEAESGKVVERIRERRPDAVILDVMFPENDKAGFEIARSIRRTFGELPVLLLTAVNQSFPLGFSSKDLDATWLPAYGFLEKPVDFELLSAMVADMLAHAPRPRPAPGRSS